MNEQNIRPLNILLVEDSIGDIKLTKRAIEKSKLMLELNVVTDGEAALNYLFKRGEFVDAQTPDLILLDLNMPKIDGREVLREIREKPDTTHIPVVILTTSDQSDDIFEAYKLHANCYITKPIDLNEFGKVVQAINNFWFAIVKLP